MNQIRSVLTKKGTVQKYIHQNRFKMEYSVVMHFLTQKYFQLQIVKVQSITRKNTLQKIYSLFFIYFLLVIITVIFLGFFRDSARTFYNFSLHELRNITKFSTCAGFVVGILDDGHLLISVLESLVGIVLASHYYMNLDGIFTFSTNTK